MKKIIYIILIALNTTMTIISMNRPVPGIQQGLPKRYYCSKYRCIMASPVGTCDRCRQQEINKTTGKK